ncbi:MAG: hypothetical protein EGQ66_00560 [Coriobacteriaceae bacterium]|nr:hypothetical protein [Coriobacteriaceae bacterium]
MYSSYGSTHGRVNVSEAITVSCNYFFYEVGRLTGIKTLDDYATQFGLGQYTGIEIGGPNSAEAKGALASPEYAEANDLEWSDGQTLTAAIGQSYNLFTPLQLANYIATLVGNGEHYAAHLLKNVKTYNNSAVVYAYDKDPVNVVEMQDSTVEAIKTGMHDLTTGSLSTYFSKCVVSAGAKTGTAETGVTNANNGTFVCFAPYDDPQIAVAIVMVFDGVMPTIHVLWFVVGLVLVMLFSIGIGLFIGALAVFFRDMIHLWSVVLTAWTYLTPIFWDLSLLTNSNAPRIVVWIVKANPMYNYLEIMRSAFVYQNNPSVTVLALAAIWAVIALVIGIAVFKKTEHKFILYI